MVAKRDPKKEFDYDLKLTGQQEGVKILQKKYKEALKVIKALERRNELVRGMKGTVKTHAIKSKESSKTSEATAVWVASDWHVEENVNPKVVLGLNEYNMSISKHRAELFFQNGLKLTDMMAKDVRISTIVIALLGDFITNDIHDELVEINEVGPMHAAIYAQNLIASGIQYVLDNSEYNLVIPCHSGNHGRTTKTSQMSTENAHSLEYFMYIYLQDHFRDNKRVKFLVADGFISYVNVYGYKLRFMHGHTVKYGGGIGGMTIPINKAIAAWDSTGHADVTIMGHFHKFFDGGNFVVNGSMIGYNAYALSIKASFEKPKQALFLMDRDRGKTIVAPIMFD